MDQLINPLFFTAASLGFIHTILGPDHYLPFVALSKSNNWSYRKTMIISTICGLAHCLSSVVIGIFGIGLGVLIGKIEYIEAVRGDVACYLMISFGLVYFIWSIKKLLKDDKHIHTHKHAQKNANNNLFWGIFIVFLFGPCEPLIPLIMYPAAKSNYFNVILVASIFTIVTISTMLIAISMALKGVAFIKFKQLAKYSHSFASLTIILCGLLIVAGL